jgi:hypothetical protein
MKLFEIVTGYTGTGALDNPYRPDVATKYTLTEWVDITGLTVAQIKAGTATTTISAQCEDSVYTKISADKLFTTKAILIEDKLL